MRDTLDAAGIPLAAFEARGVRFMDGGEDVRAFRRACVDGRVMLGGVRAALGKVMWSGVTKRFRNFHQNLRLTNSQRDEGRAHHSGVRQSLNSHYYGISSDSANSFLFGSWGKSTKMTCPR